METHPEARGETAADHVGRAMYEVPARAGALAQGVHDLLERQALRAREGHRLGDGFNDAGAHDLVGCLGGLAAAGRTEVRDGLAHGGKYGLRALEGFLAATGHDGQRAVASAFGAAAHGAVEEFNTAWVQELGRFPRGLGADGGAVEDQAAGFQGLGQCLNDFQDVRVGRDTGDDRVDARSERLDRWGCLHAQLGRQGARFLSRAIPNRGQ